MSKPDLKDYVANRDGWIAGRRVRAGDTLRLTERAARYEPVSPAKAATKSATPTKPRGTGKDA